MLSTPLQTFEPPEAAMTDTDDAYQFEFVSIDGERLPLDAWRGRPVLVVNTASFCGYTPQYSDLEALWQSYRDRGLVVLGVPSNDFGRQEPGSAGDIKQFCTSNYSVDFPLTEKYRVIGGEAHPFYRWIAESLGEAGPPARRRVAGASLPERPPHHGRNRAVTTPKASIKPAGDVTDQCPQKEVDDDDE